MSERARESRSRGLVRLVGIVVAFGLTIVAVWMIALGHSQREVSLGVITGLWAALIGAMTFYSGRHGSPLSANSASGGSDVELRQDFALELQREVSARRAYEQQLHEMVRREIETIQRVVGDQLGRLREDVATLRSDLVDQVGGKIRLERIETTRVIGSDIEALQNEVRQLAGTRLSDDTSKSSSVSSRVFQATTSNRSPTPTIATSQPGSIRTSAETIDTVAPDAATSAPPAAPVQPAYQPYVAPTYAPAVTYSAGNTGQRVPQYSAPAVAREPIEAPPLAPAAPLPAAASAAPPAPTGPTGPPGPAAPVAPAGPSLPATPAVPTFTPVAPLPRLEVPSRPSEDARGSMAPAANGANPYGIGVNGAGVNGGAHGAIDNSDPFASLPRLTKFSDIDDFDAPASTSEWRSAPPAQTPPWSAPPPTSYPVAPAGDSSDNPITNGRRHGATEDDQPRPQAPESGGGRRRRADGETNDVLARLLGDR